MPDLVSPQPQRGGTRSVLVAGFAESAWLAPDGRVEMLDGLTRLIEASLVLVEEREHAARYRQLETLRAYGTERLEAHGAAERVKERHASYYLEWAEDLAPRANGCGP